VYDHLKKELLLSVATGGSQSVARRKSEKHGSISASATTAAAAAAAAAAATAKPDKGTRRLSAGFRNKPASVNVSAGAAAKAIGDSLQAPIPTVTPKSQQEFRRRRLSYASQRTQSSNMLPVEGLDKSVLIYQSREMGAVDDVNDKPLPLPPAVLGTYSCHGIEPSWQVSNGCSSSYIC
jgi:hypothetical protein